MKIMTAPMISLVWGSFILNLLLQVFDGLFTYHVLSRGIPEANPLVRSAILEWGAAWGLLYWKGIACILLALIFALRHRRHSLTLKALTVTGTVYGCLAVAGLCELMFELSR
jgi:hypothetical protein